MKTMWTATAAAAALLVSAAPAPASNLELVDLTGEFAKVQAENSSKSPQEQAEAIRADFAKRLPGFYDPARFGDNAAKWTQSFPRKIAGFPTEREATAEAAKRFHAMFPRAVASFEKAFGPVPYKRPVYLVVSLGEFDGGTRNLPQGEVLLFGADMIAKYHAKNDVTAFFHHELFHIYHSARFADCGQVWCSLWIEGLATYVASRLNPNATDAELLLTLPEPIRPEIEADRRPAVCAAIARLDSTKNEDLAALFSFERLGPGMPPRFGYLLGDWVAADLGRTRSLEDLADLKGPSLRTEIEASLRRMAVCPPSES
jgi:hypothetical protein